MITNEYVTNLGSSKIKIPKTTRVPKTTPPAPRTASLDDTFNYCSLRIRVQSFDFGHFSGVNDYYKLVREDDVSNKKGSEGWNSHLTNGRGVYRAEKSPQNCIWWHRLYRHWWLGDCRKRGNNHGFAYLGPDETCPHDGEEGEWRRGGSDEVLKKGKVTVAVSVVEAVVKKSKEGGKNGPFPITKTRFCLHSNYSILVLCIYL